ncbi:hypothetical protein HOLleu_14686 [Holothuria leucospilota]|uniref:Uncharacterized protein n=1 Tax=Holothuria leucospilota TaxID=206669 RepID=A0A9Q1C8N1_HOLLE|nr:hypothetical protein HOLleu_14686 [Holothuria leucospilota]
MENNFRISPAMLFANQMEEKAMHAYNYVDLKTKEYNRKHLKQRYLGDVNGRYSRAKSPAAPGVVGSLVNLDFPETRAINLKTADHIISDQSQMIRQTFDKNQREAVLEEWARPPSVLIERPHQAAENTGKTGYLYAIYFHPSAVLLDSRPVWCSSAPTLPTGGPRLRPCDSDLEMDSNTSYSDSDLAGHRPHTALGSHDVNHNPFQGAPPPRPYSTGSFRTPSRKPPQPSGFMWVKMKQKGSDVKDVSFRKITDEIHDYWENEDKKDRERKRRAKSENLKRHDSFAGQWLSFAGAGPDGAGGMVDAFTGEYSDQYYNIDGKVGSTVARQLQSGTKLHIGRNGELQSESLRVKEWRRQSQKRESVEDALRNFHNTSRQEAEKVLNKPACLIPLDWSEQVAQPDVKILGISKPTTPPPREDLSERHPVVYNRLIPANAKPKVQIKLDKFCIRHRSKPKRNIDGTESLNQRITMITVDDLAKNENDNDAMTMDEYQELLRQKLESVPADEGTVGESHPDLMQRLSPRTEDDLNRDKSLSLSSLGKGSDVSGTTVDKPPSLSFESRDNTSSPTDDVPASLPSPSRRMVRNQRSAPAVAVRRSTSHGSSTTNPGIRPKSEMTRRADRKPLSGHSGRAQSSTSQRRYVFDLPPTPRSAQSPRVKRGQFHRSGVPSINSGPREGEQEYIKISHQIPSPYQATNREAPVGISDVDDVDSRPSSPGSMRGSVSSLNVLGGGEENQHIHHEENCSCTQEAKRALSAALSGLSSSHTEHGPFINIPTARLSPAGTSDLPSEVDAIRSSRLSFTQRSQPEDDDSDQYSEKEDLSDIDDYPGTPPLEDGVENGSLENHDLLDDAGGINGLEKLADNDTIPSQHPSKEEIIINREDGLQSQESLLPKKEERSISPSRPEGKRTVTFREDLLEPSAPTTTPFSTPRDSIELFSEDDAENGVAGDETGVKEEGKLDENKSQRRMGSASKELTDLREQIKSDLRQTQEEVKKDLEEMKTGLSDVT